MQTADSDRVLPICFRLSPRQSVKQQRLRRAFSSRVFSGLLKSLTRDGKDRATDGETRRIQSPNQHTTPLPVPACPSPLPGVPYLFCVLGVQLQHGSGSSGLQERKSLTSPSRAVTHLLAQTPAPASPSPWRALPGALPGWQGQLAAARRGTA